MSMTAYAQSQWVGFDPITHNVMFEITNPTYVVSPLGISNLEFDIVVDRDFTLYFGIIGYNANYIDGIKSTTLTKESFQKNVSRHISGVSNLNLPSGETFKLDMYAHFETPDWYGASSMRLPDLVTIPTLRPFVPMSIKEVVNGISVEYETSNTGDSISFDILNSSGGILSTKKIFLEGTEKVEKKTLNINFENIQNIAKVKFSGASISGGSKIINMKSAATSVISPAPESKYFISSLTNDQKITIFYSNGASTETTWGEGKYLTNRISTIQVDNEIVRNVPIFIR